MSSSSMPKSVTSKQAERVGDLINIKVGRSVNRQLVTGAHVVADISCVVCSTVVGWKYVDAKETAQKYKIGKFILETRRVVGGKYWEDMERHSEMFWECREGDKELVQGTSKGGEEAVLFDSEDEDECDDLFAGVWDPEVVKKRRGRRVANRRREE
jgi:Yippee zinc-binding/DNA-binding /Mis18, centromere assembly